jgi:hypothetical protein
MGMAAMGGQYDIWSFLKIIRNDQIEPDAAIHVLQFPLTLRMIFA